MKNILLLTLLAGLFYIAILAAMHSIDRITVRDCERGIKQACEYLPTNN